MARIIEASSWDKSSSSLVSWDEQGLRIFINLNVSIKRTIHMLVIIYLLPHEFQWSMWSCRLEKHRLKMSNILRSHALDANIFPSCEDNVGSWYCRTDRKIIMHLSSACYRCRDSLHCTKTNQILRTLDRCKTFNGTILRFASNRGKCK